MTQKYSKSCTAEAMSLKHSSSSHGPALSLCKTKQINKSLGKVLPVAFLNFIPSVSKYHLVACYSVLPFMTKIERLQSCREDTDGQLCKLFQLNHKTVKQMIHVSCDGPVPPRNKVNP